MRRLLPLTLVLLTALAVPAVATTTATGPSHRIDWRLGTAFTPGKARALGTVNFLEAGRRMDIDVRVDDRCPNDRHVVRFFVALTYRDGSKDSTGVIDDRGCAPTTAKRLRWRSPASASRIRSVRIDFYEHDSRTMSIGDYREAHVLRP